jgi:hypothetical protein
LKRELVRWLSNLDKSQQRRVKNQQELATIPTHPTQIQNKFAVSKKPEPKKPQEQVTSVGISIPASGLAKLDIILKQSKDQISQEAARLRSQQKKRPHPSAVASPKTNTNSHQKSVQETASVMSSRSIEKLKLLAEEDKKQREQAKKIKEEKVLLLRGQVQDFKVQHAEAITRSKSRVTQEKQERAQKVKKEKEALKEMKAEKSLIQKENQKKQKLIKELEKEEKKYQLSIKFNDGDAVEGENQKDGKYPSHP